MTVKLEPGLRREGAFADFAEMAAFGPPGWGMQHLQLGGGRAHAAYASVETATVRLSAGQWSHGALTRGAAPRGTFAIALSDCGPAIIRFQGRSVEPRQVAMLPGGCDCEYVAPRACDALLLTIGQDTFARYTNAIWHSDPPTARDGYRLTLADDASRPHLRRWFAEFFATLQDRAATLSDPRIAALADDHLLTTILTATQTTPLRLIPSYRHNCARDAARYIHSRQDEPVTLAELCEAIGVSLRALEHGFRELYGVTPKVYMRIVRLHGVRNSLRSADPAAATVTEIATRWGFFHFGRFSVEYRRLFGESPSDTLWKRRPNGSAASLLMPSDRGPRAGS